MCTRARPYGRAGRCGFGGRGVTLIQPCGRINKSFVSVGLSLGAGGLTAWTRRFNRLEPLTASFSNGSLRRSNRLVEAV
jgi:hypothetical protein